MSDTYLTRKTLLRRMKSMTDEESWNEFVSFYRGFIFSIINRMGICSGDSDDLVQKVLLKVWKSVSNFDLNQQQGRFRNWLYTITKNTVLNYIDEQRTKQKAKDQVIIDNESLKTPEIDEIIQNEWEKHISEMAFRIVREKMSEQAMEAFQAGLRNEPVSMTAKKLGLEENTIYMHKNRVKHKLMAEIRNLREMLE